MQLGSLNAHGSPFSYTYTIVPLLMYTTVPRRGSEMGRASSGAHREGGPTEAPGSRLDAGGAWPPLGAVAALHLVPREGPPRPEPLDDRGRGPRTWRGTRGVTWREGRRATWRPRSRTTSSWASPRGSRDCPPLGSSARAPSTLANPGLEEPRFRRSGVRLARATTHPEPAQRRGQRGARAACAAADGAT